VSAQVAQSDERVLDPITAPVLAETIAGQIRAAIQSGAYAPGMRLPERRLAADLGVSHIPVREALARLAEEGLVEREPRRGARVAGLSRRQLDEISSLRIVLEQFVARRVQEVWSPAIERELRAIARAMVAAADNGDATRVIELDQRFHERLWEAAGHDLLNELAAMVRRRVTSFLVSATRALPPADLRAHALTHVALIRALASGDRGRAERETERHISLAADRVRRTLPDEEGP
jgi:DNA-binding GntR family transcriptional regulator